MKEFVFTIHMIISNNCHGLQYLLAKKMLLAKDANLI
jgi:hypothetical protein